MKNIQQKNLQDSKSYIQSKVKIAAPRKNKILAPKNIEMHQKNSNRHPRKSANLSKERYPSVMMMRWIGR